MKKKEGEITINDIIPQDHWEKNYSCREKKRDDPNLWRMFDPVQGKDRLTTYKKVNETDH